MTELEVVDSLLDTIASERTAIEDQMKDIYPTTYGFAYNKAKPDGSTQYNPSALPILEQNERAEIGSLLAGKLEHNGHACDLIQRCIARADKWPFTIQTSCWPDEAPEHWAREKVKEVT